MASRGKRNQGRTWTTFCSLFCMPELLPKVGVLLACFFDRYKNFKFINWYLDVTIEYKYNVQCFCLKRILNIIIQAGIFREYRNKCFWRPKCFGKAIPQIMTLQILSGKGAVQIMPLRKLGGKFHFFLRFCTRKQSKTYVSSSIRLNLLPFFFHHFWHWSKWISVNIFRLQEICWGYSYDVGEESDDLL